MRKLLTALLATAMLTLIPAPAEARPSYEDRVAGWINRHREARGLAPLEQRSCATSYARAYSRRLGYPLTHSQVSALWGRCSATRAGEAIGFTSGTPFRLVRLWMRSPGHRRLLMSPQYRYFGVGIDRRPYGTKFAAVELVG